MKTSKIISNINKTLAILRKPYRAYIVLAVTVWFMIILSYVYYQYKKVAPPAKVATNSKQVYELPNLGHASSSVDSEKQFAPSEQWKGQPSKCFDCEADMAARCGDACVFNATKQKLFSNN